MKALVLGCLVRLVQFAGFLLLMLAIALLVPRLACHGGATGKAGQT